MMGKPMAGTSVASPHPKPYSAPDPGMGKRVQERRAAGQGRRLPQPDKPQGYDGEACVPAGRDLPPGGCPRAARPVGVPV